MPRVLCVDDKRDVAETIAEIFSAWKGCPFGTFSVEIETDFNRAIQRLKHEHFDLVTLDLHGPTDAEPIRDDGNQEGQEGKRVLEALRETRFVPVIFYTGFADKIAALQTGVVKVVKKGANDLADVRAATTAIYETGLPDLLTHIEEEKRAFIWDTIDRHWEKVGAGGSPEDLAYLLARRLAARFNRESVKELLKHKIGAARPVEMYIYPPLSEKIKTGCIIKEGEKHWLVATPACDFAQGNAESVLLVGAMALADHVRYKEWIPTKWNGKGNAPSNDAKKFYDRFRQLLVNNAGERYRFLPGTFFLPDLVIDMQNLRHVTPKEVSEAELVCRLDSPFREDLLLQVSRYYGRVGTPELEVSLVVDRL